MMIQLLSELLPNKPVPFDIHCPRPDAESILVDDTYAIMPKPTFDKLIPYMPKHVEEGRVWKFKFKDLWYLCWWSDQRTDATTGVVSVKSNYREILFLS